ncbi:glutamyl-tRNA reductase [Herpetosiphon llansteffanensis]
MQLVVVGAHQRTAPISIRERIAFAEAELAQALHNLGQIAVEGFILSTCNRVELYALVAEPDGGRSLRQFLAQQRFIDLDELMPHLYTYIDDDAVRHLFRVASGLDSMALGEAQILSQIKTAYTAAQQTELLGTTMHRLIQAALTTGKLVRTETQLAHAQLSVVSVGLSLARQHIELSNRSVVIIGAGRTGELALKHYLEHTSNITVLSRTFERAARLAEHHKVVAKPMSELMATLEASDVVISCTSSPELMLDLAQAQALQAQRQRPWVLLDLAVPRDIDRHIGALADVWLYDVDDMQAICERNRASKAAEVAGAETIVERELFKWQEWWSTQAVLPTIRALRAHAEAIRLAELERALARLDLSEQEQAAVSALTSAIINKLLHQPMRAIKDTAASPQLAHAAQQLFRLDFEAIA